MAKNKETQPEGTNKRYNEIPIPISTEILQVSDEESVLLPKSPLESTRVVLQKYIRTDHYKAAPTKIALIGRVDFLDTDNNETRFWIAVNELAIIQDTIKTSEISKEKKPEYQQMLKHMQLAIEAKKDPKNVPAVVAVPPEDTSGLKLNKQIFWSYDTTPLPEIGLDILYARAWQIGNDKKAREKLIFSNTGIIAKYVHRYSWGYGNGRINEEDLIAEGYAALTRATDLYDYTKGLRFSTYAGRTIQNELAQYVNLFKNPIRLSYNRNDLIPTIQDTLQANPNINIYTSEGVAQVALACNIDEATVREIFEYQRMMGAMASLDEEFDEDGNPHTLYDILPAASVENSGELERIKELKMRLRQLFESRLANQKNANQFNGKDGLEILRLRFLLTPLSTHEIGKALGITPETADRIEHLVTHGKSSQTQTEVSEPLIRRYEEILSGLSLLTYEEMGRMLGLASKTLVQKYLDRALETVGLVFIRSENIYRQMTN